MDVRVEHARQQERVSLHDCCESVDDGHMWLGLGVLGIWAVVLSNTELNFAFSLSSVHYIFIALSSKFILKERVEGKRWFGTVLITLGIAIVSFSRD